MLLPAVAAANDVEIMVDEGCVVAFDGGALLVSTEALVLSILSVVSIITRRHRGISDTAPTSALRVCDDKQSHCCTARFRGNSRSNEMLSFVMGVSAAVVGPAE